jgi:hypothetical protein
VRTGYISRPGTRTCTSDVKSSDLSKRLSELGNGGEIGRKGWICPSLKNSTGGSGREETFGAKRLVHGKGGRVGEEHRSGKEVT